MKRRIKNVFSIIICLVLCTVFYIDAFATCQVSSCKFESDAGWAFMKTSQAHRGKKANQYRFDSDEIKEKYENDLLDAVDLWGTRITFTETTNTGYGKIVVDNSASSTVVASVSGLLTDNDNHFLNSFTITINSPVYDNVSSSLKPIALAHEIGHVYGMGHIEDNTKLMNPHLVSTMSITTTDARGMNVCIHAHRPQSSCTIEYRQSDNTLHRKSCTVCKLYKTERHTWDSNNKCTLCGAMKQ